MANIMCIVKNSDQPLPAFCPVFSVTPGAPKLIELALKAPNKNCIFIFYFYLLKKIRIDLSCESSAEQRIHLKHQVLFILKSNEKIFECRLLQS